MQRFYKSSSMLRLVTTNRQRLLIESFAIRIKIDDILSAKVIIIPSTAWIGGMPDNLRKAITRQLQLILGKKSQEVNLSAISASAAIYNFDEPYNERSWIDFLNSCKTFPTTVKIELQNKSLMNIKST